MIRRFALWLAEWSDRWARRLHDDAAGERLAEAWEVDRGVLIDDTYLRRQARQRHPAGSRLPH